MTQFAVCSVKGAPGATTLALAMTYALAHDLGDAAFVEADPAGGDLAGLVGLAVDPGMTSLAAASRHESVEPDARAHAQALPGGGWGLLGATDPTQASATVASLASRLPQSLADAAPGAVVDCGRWHAQSPVGPLLTRVGATAVCIRADVPSVEAVRARLADLRLATRGQVGLVVCGPDPYGADQIEASVGLPVLGRFPFDAKGCAALMGGGRRRLDRLPLVRAARSAVLALADLAEPPSATKRPPVLSSNGVRP